MNEDVIKLQTLRKHPFFHDWSQAILTDLAAALSPVKFSNGEMIIRQNDVVDSLYFITSGKAEASNADESSGKINIIATLGPGEAIGLSDSGFFAPHGIRTANVMALNDVTAYKLDLIEINSILKKHGNINQDFLQSLDMRLKMRLIKQAAPFYHLSNSAITELAANILTVTAQPNQVLFRQGDDGDYCYLICSGLIAIDQTDSEGKVHRIATLNALQVFGETALLMSAKRNSTATALSECKLLAIPKQIFLDIIKREKKSAESFTALILERANPKTNTAVISSKITNSSGDEILVLKNTNNFEYMQLFTYGIRVWELLYTQHNMREILQIINHEFSDVTVREIMDLMLTLTEDGFIQLKGITNEQQSAQHTRLQIVMGIIKDLMEISYTFNNTDQWITKTYNAFFKYIFTRLSIYIFSLIGIVGFIAFIIFTPKALTISQTQSVSMLVIMLLVGTLMVIPHELGHAYMTKSYGREVHYFGIGWYWAGPIAFTDTTDMWLSPRKERIAVDMAGNYVDVIIAGIFAIAGYIIPDPAIALMCWMVSLVTYLLTYINLDTILELDGYFVLMDYLDEPNLREDAVVWLINEFPACLRTPALFKENMNAVIYWLVSIISIVMRILIIIFLQQFFLVRFTHNAHLGLEWILPIAVGLLSLFSVWTDARKRIKSLDLD